MGQHASAYGDLFLYIMHGDFSILGPFPSIMRKFVFGILTNLAFFFQILLLMHSLSTRTEEL